MNYIRRYSLYVYSKKSSCDVTEFKLQTYINEKTAIANLKKFKLKGNVFAIKCFYESDDGSQLLVAERYK